MVSRYVKVSVIVVLCLWVQNGQPHQLPKDFSRCRHADEKCLLKRIHEIVKEYPDGYPELLLERIDPSPIGSFKLSPANPDNPVNINLEINDAQLHGYKNITFTKFTGFTKDPKGMKLEFECMIPRVIIKGKYKVKGQLLILPITGEGDVEITIFELKMKGQMKPLTEVRNGKTYLMPANTQLKIKAENVMIEMENLFNGDKLLSENMLKVMNENWKILWDELQPYFTAQILKDNDKKYEAIFNNIPYDDFFISD